MFFRWAAHTARDEEDFDALNKLYCGVSGSTVRPGSTPDLVRVQHLGGEHVCGDYYRCCWPCSCDVEKYSKAEDMDISLADGSVVSRTVLSIADPCASPADIPGQVDAFQCENGQTTNALRTPSGRIAIATLHHASKDRCDDYEIIRGCAHRNATPRCDLQGGMGDLFATVACAGSDTTVCKC